MAIKIDGILVAGKGKDGIGVPGGGTTGQILSKSSNNDYETQWITITSDGVSSDTVSTMIANALANETATEGTIATKSELATAIQEAIDSAWEASY